LYAVRDCLFSILAATLHIVGRSSICDQRTRHDVVTGTHLSVPRKTTGIIIDISIGLRNGVSVVKLRILRFSQLTSVTVTSASEIRTAADSVIMMARKYLYCINHLFRSSGRTRTHVHMTLLQACVPSCIKEFSETQE
jgi:uncharacterized protein YjhX (UPF0386 family)